jgi:carbon-monoxide dehydrogenase large subunit
MPAKTAAAPRWVGRRSKRKEDPRLIQGISHYTDDLKLPGMLYAAFVRSPYAHAKIRSISTEAARSAPGVVGVFTSADMPNLGGAPYAGGMPGLKTPPNPPLAKEVVRHVGESVAVVVAEDAYAARDAAELVEVDYEALPVVSDVEKAIEKGSTLVHPEFKTNLAYVHELKTGDAAAGFKRADKVVQLRMTNQRLVPVAMETRGVVAEYRPGENVLTVWTSTQIPHLAKTQIAVMLGIPENSVRVVTPEVGGGFGSKLNVYREEGVIPWLAMKLGRPVKWSETRRENVLATIHGRDHIQNVELALKRDGTILALRARILADLGAYHQLLTPNIPTLTSLMITGCYKIPAIDVEVRGAFTNKMSTDAYRGAGRPEATYLIERMMDMAADELGLDPAEIRRRNFPKPTEFPFATATGLSYDSGNYQGALKKALAISGYDKLRTRQKAGWKQGKYYGIGLSTYVEICALGPSAAMPAGGWESATVRIDPTGAVTVLTGASPHGQGQETSFAQIVADELGISPDAITVVHGDTAAVPYGIGTFGSRATAVGGTAALYATQKLKHKLMVFAAHLLNAKPAKVSYSHGRFSVRGTRKSLPFGEVVMAAYTAKTLPPGVDPGLEATHFFEPTNFTFPFGTHICSVEVDPETGQVLIDKYLAVDDCGKVINPLLVEGQLHGGIAQGLGQALYEEMVYDSEGQAVTGELMEYAVPKAEHLPRFELAHTTTPSPVNPMGIKGVGEAGTIASTAAIVGAVCDALTPLGIRHLDMPLKPEKVWRAIRDAQHRSANTAASASAKARASAPAAPKAKPAPPKKPAARVKPAAKARRGSKSRPARRRS